MLATHYHPLTLEIHGHPETMTIYTEAAALAPPLPPPTSLGPADELRLPFLVLRIT